MKVPHIPVNGSNPIDSFFQLHNFHSPPPHPKKLLLYHKEFPSKNQPVSIFFLVIEPHRDVKSRRAGGPAEKDLGLPARSPRRPPGVHSAPTELRVLPL